MKATALLRMGSVAFLLGSAKLHADSSGDMVPQSQIEINPGTSGILNADWEGVNGRTYLMQWSEDMVHWNYFPLTEAGAGSKAYGFATSTDKFFVRLHCTDETPDLSKTSVWQPPLLLIGGEWMVLTKQTNGTPVSGVGLTFRRWPSTSTGPLPAPIFKAVTDSNGSYTFDPGILSSGDRVEVRISGSPNQRVYLPASSGQETSDPGLPGTTLGGSGLSLSGILTSAGSGLAPNLSNNSNGGGSGGSGENNDGGCGGDNAPNEPVYRFQDFLTSNYSADAGGWDNTYPSGFHQVTRSQFSGGNNGPQNTDRKTPDDYVGQNASGGYWSQIPGLGSASKPSSGSFTTWPCERTLEVDFGDPSLQIEVQRTIFTTFFDASVSSTLGSLYYLENTVYGTTSLTLRDGVSKNLGNAEIPLVPEDYPGPSIETYNRAVVLGPVPMHVPREVLGGQPFYYADFAKATLGAELPLGCNLMSYLYCAETNTIVEIGPRVAWTVTKTGAPNHKVLLTNMEGMNSDTGTIESHWSRPAVTISFVKNAASNEEVQPFEGNTDVTVSAVLKIPHTARPDSTKPEGYAFDFSDHPIGSFTTELQHTDCGGGAPGTGPSTPMGISLRQMDELNGKRGDAPESDGFNGGQRMRKCAEEWKIGVTGHPAPNSPTYVNALTGRFHHGEVDFSLQIPGSELSLAVTRSSTDTTWNKVFGLLPSENPLLAFGAGWDSSLAGSLLRVGTVLPDGSQWSPPQTDPRKLAGRIVVRDYMGASYGFLEHVGIDGVTRWFPDPTMLPSRDTSDISLATGDGVHFILSQPALGRTHVFEKSSIDFMIPNNRDTPTDGATNLSGFTRYEYFKLTQVTDRYGVTLNYTYGSDTSCLIPASVSVQGRPGLQLGFTQSGGRVTAFWDPSGVKHTYSYDNRSFSASGQPSVSLSVLTSHQAGSIITATYGYDYFDEADPRPAQMLLGTTGGSAYRIRTHHLSPSSITNGVGETLTIHQRLSETRWAWSDAGDAYYHPAGDPVVVDSITLPNNIAVGFSLQHTLKNGRSLIPSDGTNPEVPAVPSVYSVTTGVTTMEGDHWNYTFGTPVRYNWSVLSSDKSFFPTASALFFPSLSRSCAEVSNSSIQYQYDACAGFELNRVTDAAGRTSSVNHGEVYAISCPNPFYTAPRVAGGNRLNSCFDLASSSTDRLGHTTTYSYVKNAGHADHMLVSGITDFRDRTLVPSRGAQGRTDSVSLTKDGTTLAQVDLAYSSTFAGAVTKITQKALSGSGDPAWVTDLVKDIQLDSNGFPHVIGNNAAGLHTTITRGPSGRVLSVAKPNGGVRSHQYNHSGVLEKTFFEDGGCISYEHDLAGRTVFLRDAMGIASGIEFDPLGRVTKAVRDMNGNLGFNAGGGLTGVDAGTDLIASTQFLDATHEVRMTDPRGFISVRRFNAYGQTVKTITPGNERAAGTVPDETNDRVTDIVYDLLESPNSPVSVSDPSGYETIYKFDELARLTKILREYGEDSSNNDLYSGTVFGYDATTGLPDTITAIRTPLDVDGNPVGGAALEQLTTRIERDELDRARTSIFAEGTDKELRSQDSFTSTGIRWRKEVRDIIANDPAQDHWNVWELECDSLGRTTKRVQPEIIDALTGNPAPPHTAYFYDDHGNLSQTGDSYGKLTTYGYDIRGRLSWRKEPAVKDAKSGQTLEPIRTYAYDANGLLIHSVDPLGYAWDYTRDAAGRVKIATGPIVSPAAASDKRRPVWERDYDPAGNLLQVIDPEGHTQSLAYYPDNRMKDVTTPVTFTDESGSPSLVDVVEHYTRDSLGRVIQVEDGKHQVTSFTYDGLGRQLTSTRDPGDTRAKTETITYDALLPTSIEDAAGLVKELGYDDQFRLSRVDVIGNAAESLDFTHDLLGNLTGISPVTAPTDLSMGDPSISRSHDALGLLQEETSNGVTTTYGYDLNGQLSKVTNSANSRTLSIQHDAAGRNSRVVDSGFGATLETLFGHDLAGNLVREEMSNGLVQESDFDPIHRVTSRRVRNTGGTVCRTDYQYDLVSNVTRIEETTNTPGGLPDRLIETTYNEIGQLLTENQSRTGGSLGSSIHRTIETHRYDAAENRVSTGVQNQVDGVSIGSLSRVFDYGDATDGFNSNQLRQLTETPGGGTAAVTSYQYDDNGNRTGRTVGAATDVYTWDSFNRLTGYQLNTAGSGQNGEWHYAYDPQSRRIARKAAGQTARQFAFSGSSPVHEWDGALNNGSLVDNIGGGVGGRLYSQNASAVSVWAFQNVRGDLTAEFSSSGSMTWQGTWNADGLLKDQSGTRSGNYGPNGKWQEPGDLTNEGFRYLDRLTGTFLSRDPAGFIDGLNDYNYVHRNPWSAWDPFGLSTEGVPSGTNDIGYTGQGHPVDAVIIDGHPMMVYRDWSGGGIIYVWNSVIWGGTTEWNQPPSPEELNRCFYREDGVWHLRSPEARTNIHKEESIAGIDEEMESIKWAIDSMEIGGAAIASTPLIVVAGSQEAGAYVIVYGGQMAKSFVVRLALGMLATQTGYEFVTNEGTRNEIVGTILSDPNGVRAAGEVVVIGVRGIGSRSATLWESVSGAFAPSYRGMPRLAPGMVRSPFTFGVNRRTQTIGDVTLPTERSARREAMRRYGIETSKANNYTREESYGKNENLRGPNGEPSETIKSTRPDGSEVEIEHHKWGHRFTDDNTYELPHYQGPNGEHISYGKE